MPVSGDTRQEIPKSPARFEPVFFVPALAAILPGAARSKRALQRRCDGS
jgi:hypothetical protein